MKSGSYISNFGSKGQPFGNFLDALIVWQDIWTHLGQFVLLLCTRIQDDERNVPRKFEDKLPLIKVSNGRCPKALNDFADFSVLCQVGRFTFAFSYQFRIIFLCFGIFPFDRTSFFQLHNTRKYRYRARRANRSNRPTKVTSLHRVQIWHLS